MESLDLSARSEHPDYPDHPDLPEYSDHSDHSDHSDRSDRSDRSAPSRSQGLGRLALLGVLLGSLACAHGKQASGSVGEASSSSDSESSQPFRRVEGQLVLEGIPPIPPEVSARLQQYQNVRGASLLDWDFEGGMLIATRFGETTQVHHVDAAQMARRQLTFFDEPVRGAWVSALNPSSPSSPSNPSSPANPKGPNDPTGSSAHSELGGLPGFVFLMDAGGGENYQLHWFDLQGGSSRLLSDGKSRNQAPLPARNSDDFVFSSNARNGKDFDLWRMSPQSGEEPELLLELEGYWVPVDWSFDDSRLLLLNYRSINSSSLHVFDLESKQLSLVPLPAGVEQAAYRSAVFLPDGSLLYASDSGGEFHHLIHHDLKSGKREDLTPELNWDVEGLELSPDGTRFAFLVNEGGKSALYLGNTSLAAKAGGRSKSSSSPLSASPVSVSPEVMKRAQAVEIPVGVVGSLSFSRDGQRLGFGLSGAQTGSDVWVLELGELATAQAKAEGRSSGVELVRWTQSEIGGLNPETFVAPTLINFPSFDGREIPAWLYLPKQASASAPVPVIVDIHGGPEAQSKAYFSPLAQHRVNELGVAVLYPNVRGSAGYGRSWLKLDDGFKREDSVKDIGALLDWIATQPELDSSKVAVSGGSYGGYMVLASLFHFGDRLRCGVDVVGISHFVTFLENTESYRRDLRRAEYGDERDPEMRDFLHRISPLTNAAKIDRPLFVAQGLNDPRVPASEAEQIVETVRKNGGEVWYFLAKDEGHGFAKKSNRDAYLNAQTLFFERCLLSEDL